MDVRWVWVFLDLPEEGFEEAVRFWGAVTGSTLSSPRGDRGQFATLLPAEGDAWVKVQRLDEGPRVHVDLDVEGDLAVARDEVLALGGSVVLEHDDVVVCRSPGGFTFCLTRWSPSDSGRGQVRVGAQRAARPGVPRHPCGARMPPRSPSGRGSPGGSGTTRGATSSSGCGATPGSRCRCCSSGSTTRTDPCGRTSTSPRPTWRDEVARHEQAGADGRRSRSRLDRARRARGDALLRDVPPGGPAAGRRPGHGLTRLPAVQPVHRPGRRVGGRAQARDAAGRPSRRRRRRVAPVGGDPGELQALAQPDAGRGRRGAGGGRAGRVPRRGVRWRSPAAELFRERVRERAAGLRRVAAQVEEAADLLGAHARAVAVQLARAEETRRRPRRGRAAGLAWRERGRRRPGASGWWSREVSAGPPWGWTTSTAPHGGWPPARPGWRCSAPASLRWPPTRHPSPPCRCRPATAALAATAAAPGHGPARARG